jgi:glycosyltransferase involved in cell wall biosynthesis
MYLVEACLLLRRTRAQQIDWIHAHFGTNSTTVAMLCHALGGPKYSFTCHGPEEFDRPEALHLSEKIARASLVVAVSQFGRSQMYRWCEYQHWHKIHVVHCGVDPSYLSLLPSTPPEAPRLVSIGRLHEQKGTLLLVTAAKELVAQGTSLELILVGDGPMRTEVEALIKTFQLEDFVKLVGWQTHDQIQEWLAQSRALVLPSFAEGLPVVIMEALASYRPVITTFIAGIPELVRPGESGWLVPAGDVESLIQAMRAALTAPAEQLAAMGAAGARRVAQRHDVDQQATRLVQRIGAAWRNATPGGVPSASIPLGGRPGQYVPGQNSQVDQLSHDFSHLEQK